MNNKNLRKRRVRLSSVTGFTFSRECERVVHGESSGNGHSGSTDHHYHTLQLQLEGWRSPLSIQAIT
jgi:ribosomal protein L15